MASLSVAVASACMLLGSLFTVNANAAGRVVVVRPNARTTAPQLKKPVARALPTRSNSNDGPRAVDRPQVAPWGTAVDFQNNYGQTVWVAIRGYNTGCDGSWEDEGWYKVDPGESVEAFTTSNEYAYFYAQAANGAVWSGDYAGTIDPTAAYDFCTTSNSNAMGVGMQQIDLGGGAPWDWYTSYTINLNP
jgi:uncharacterized membrane protein